MTEESAEDEWLASIEAWRKKVINDRIQQKRKRGYRDPSGLHDVIQLYLKKNQLHKKPKTEEWTKIWEETVGQEIAEQTRVLQFQKNVLHVGVSNAALRAELEAFYLDSLIESIRAVQPDRLLRTIQFTLITSEDQKTNG